MNLGFPEQEPAGYSIRRRADAELPELVLEGELDLRAASELREALLTELADGGGTVRLDMAGLTFMDSTIISVLIMAKKRAESAGGEVRLSNMSERVRRIFSITGITELFSIEES